MLWLPGDEQISMKLTPSPQVIADKLGFDLSNKQLVFVSRLDIFDGSATPPGDVEQPLGSRSEMSFFWSVRSLGTNTVHGELWVWVQPATATGMEGEKIALANIPIKIDGTSRDGMLSLAGTLLGWSFFFLAGFVFYRYFAKKASSKLS